MSWIEVRLSDDPSGGAWLELKHIAEVPEEVWSQFGPGAAGVGWDLGLLGLAQHLATGRTIPPEATDWMSSPEGKAFVASSSDGWAQASIAAGTPPEDAMPARDRTTEFYTAAP